MEEEGTYIRRVPEVLVVDVFGRDGWFVHYLVLLFEVARIVCDGTPFEFLVSVGAHDVFVVGGGVNKFSGEEKGECELYTRYDAAPQ